MVEGEPYSKTKNMAYIYQHKNIESKRTRYGQVEINAKVDKESFK